MARRNRNISFTKWIIFFGIIGVVFLQYNAKECECGKNERKVDLSEGKSQKKQPTTEAHEKKETTTLPPQKNSKVVDGKKLPNLEHPWIYHAPFNESLKGKRFNVTSSMRYKLHMPITKFVTLSNNTWLDEIIIVTAASENHFNESLETIGSVQKNDPNRKVVFYDLGLTPAQAKMVKSFCNVIYKVFNLSKFPPHFKKLGFCAWKPVMIHEVFQNYNAVLWMDSSVRILEPLSKFENLYASLERSKGITLFSKASHTIFPTVHPQMFQYLPSDKEKLKTLLAWQAGLEIIFKTKEVYNNILYWWTMCSIDENCVAPTKTKKCPFPLSTRDKFNCHRFDQSAFNIILHNYYNFDYKTFVFPRAYNRYITVNRSGKEYQTKSCQ